MKLNSTQLWVLHRIRTHKVGSQKHQVAGPSGFDWLLWVLNGHYWILLVIMFFNCVFIGDYGQLWVFNGDYGFLMAIMGECGLLWVIMGL